MTTDMIRRRVAAPVFSEGAAEHAPQRADRIIVPGRCRGDVEALSLHYGVPVERGPEELKDLPRHFNRSAQAVEALRTAISASAMAG